MTTPKQGLPDTPKRGRPLALNPQLAAQICDHIAHGNYREIAAQACGVPRRTMVRWCKLGREGKDPYAEFWLQVMRAECSAEIESVRKIVLAGADDPKHLQWFLERKFPERWSKERLQIADLQKRLAELEALLSAEAAAKTGEATAKS